MHKLRRWYDIFNLTYYFTHEGPNNHLDYAESEDGVNWVKPRLEGFPFGGYERTKNVMTGRGGKRASAAQEILNPHTSPAKRRYMMLLVGTT